MFGNLVNNEQLINLVSNKEIQFIPYFDDNKAQIAQYPLTPAGLFRRDGAGKWKQVHSFKDDGDSYHFEANEYLLVDVLEQILLPKGIVGRFIRSSNLVEDGFSLNAGKIEYPYCHDGERIRFGIKNLMNERNSFSCKRGMAYIEFYDLRGRNNREIPLSERDKKVYGRRHPANHDGEINYEVDAPW